MGWVTKREFLNIGDIYSGYLKLVGKLGDFLNDSFNFWIVHLLVIVKCDIRAVAVKVLYARRILSKIYCFCVVKWLVCHLIESCQLFCWIFQLSLVLLVLHW